MPDPTNSLDNNDSPKSAPESGEPLESGRSRGHIIDDDPTRRLQEDCCNDPHYASHEAAITSQHPKQQQ